MFTRLTKRFGIIPIPIYTKSLKCKISCFYCPTQKHIAKSYIQNCDTCFAKLNDYDPFAQIDKWKKKLTSKYPKGSPYKLEIIILGGTFSDLSKRYRIQFFKRMFDALNDVCSMSLNDAIRLNKSSKFRACVITIETRPDCITADECEFMLSIGISKVEMGVQSIYDNILKAINRPYSIEDVSKANSILKNYGFKIGYHIMLNLPNSSTLLDKKMLDSICTGVIEYPDYLKIYPLTLVKDRKAQPILWNLYKTGKWKPYSFNELIQVLYPFYFNVPEYIRVQRIQRQFGNMDYLYSNLNITQELNKIAKSEKIESKNLRIQELKSYNASDKDFDISNIIYDICNYSRYDYFLTIKNKDDYLLGYVRLYLNGKAILREIKVLGESSAVGRRSNIQNRGLGNSLIKYVENFVNTKCGREYLYVIASPGVRLFFENLGYFEEKNLLKKDLNDKN